uniref:Uncharacterized protein n=1 Tax=Anguilla anguilla TaxID=7936 RepID=A0A0E9QSX9_ANGAN
MWARCWSMTWVLVTLSKLCGLD